MIMWGGILLIILKIYMKEIKYYLDFIFMEDGFMKVEIIWVLRDFWIIYRYC